MTLPSSPAASSPASSFSGAHRSVVVVGAGLAGLSAAAHLSSAGLAVTVIEAESQAGGLVRTESVGGHRFDTGATVLTMPELVLDALVAAGLSEDEATARLALTPVDPGYSMGFADGSRLTIPHRREAVPDAVAEAFGSAAAGDVARLLDWLDAVYDAEFDSFIDRNYDRPIRLLDARTRRSVAELVRLRAVGRLAPAIARQVADPRLQRAFTFQALYAGVPPRHALAVYSIIADMDIGRGIWHPAGGIGRVGTVLAEALREAGVTIHTGTAVRRVSRDGRRITGVITDEAGPGAVPADAVIMTPERPTVAALLGERVRRRIRYSPSAVVWHGVLPAQTVADWPAGHHTVDFGEAWHDTFVDLTRRPGRIMQDPSFLITRSAVSDPATYRRDGQESISVLAPTPNLDSAAIDWDRVAEPYVAENLAILADRGYRGIDSLEPLRIDHPGSWLAAGLPAGTPFSAAHTLAQTGPLRPGNRWPGTTNLFLAGSATVPGVGVPPVLISGKLAAERTRRLLGVDR